MNLTASENLLHTKVKNLVALERKTLKEILDNLQIVFDTRLFAKMGHSSITKYMVKELGYSESAAYRRSQALKLTKEIPATKEMIGDGSLNLSNIGKLQTLFKDQDKDSKLHVLDQIKNKTTLETEKILFDNLPEKPLPHEKRRKVSSTHTQISVTLSDTAVEKLNRLKARTKNYDTALLLEEALDIMLASTDLTKKRTNKSKGPSKPRTITAQVKKEIFLRSKEKCEYPGCDEIHNLEIDHIKPVAHGGTNNKENLRLLCKSHNQLFALQVFGRKKTAKYWR